MLLLEIVLSDEDKTYLDRGLNNDCLSLDFATHVLTSPSGKSDPGMLKNAP